ncbi:MAG: hypothetical protein OEL20_10030 [Sulfuritalea sp.]|nr:hypothetical protein [Sulfuritalea sp.]
MSAIGAGISFTNETFRRNFMILCALRQEVRATKRSSQHTSKIKNPATKTRFFGAMIPAGRWETGGNLGFLLFQA